MKKIFKTSMLMVVLFGCVFTSNVNASEIFYTNLKGVEMTETEYNKIVNIFSEQKAKTISQEDFDKYVNSNIIDSNTLYQRDVYQNNELQYTEMISKEEYDEASDINSCNSNARDSDSGYYETTYKKLSVSLFDSSVFYLLGSLSWKKVPAVRSYDVFAFRIQHFNYSTVTGNQTYYVGSSYTEIDYDSSSAGYNAQSNGAGFSMNLKDGSNITSYELTIAANLTINTSSYSQAHVYTSYQHSQSDLTRAQSMSYTLDIGGLGNVVYFSDSTIESKYDGMSGVHLTTPI